MYFYCRIYFPIITDLAIMCKLKEILHALNSVFKMAMLIQYLVYCKLPIKLMWKICTVNPPTLTFLEFYKQESSVSNRHLATVFVGKTAPQRY